MGIVPNDRVSTEGGQLQDLDLAHRQDAEAATNDLLAAQAVELADYFVFQIEGSRDLGEATEGTLRFRVRADVDSRRFEIITLDIGFSEPNELPSTPVPAPDLLGFAGIPAIEVPTIPIEVHVAEKLHAYTREFADRLNTRAKDLIDLVLISSEIEFDSWKLRQAIDKTFGSRGVQLVPEQLPLPPENWAIPYRKLAQDTGLDPDTAIGHAMVAAFLDPILANAASPMARWTPETRAWKEPDDEESSG